MRSYSHLYRIGGNYALDIPDEHQHSVEGQAGDLPELKIEITPAMIEVGVSELARYNPDYESADDAVARIYESMFWLSPQRT